MSFPGRAGELLDLRELEQLVDQLSRLPSRQAQLELVPGSEVGGSRVRLKGERDKPWRVSATRNNDGDVSTGGGRSGPGAWTGTARWAWPTRLDLRANRDAVTDRWRHSDSQSLFYSLPGAGGPSLRLQPERLAHATRPAASPSSSMATAAATSSAPNACCTATVWRGPPP
ncbi:hypothetical protein MX655_09770 [Pseudomonas aeruginosa]|nr:POTRA domain-containing protein [Pseudomonas aeruginosa]MCK1825830.1 hypothetical protein [Pseudomonas aeruginosa]